MTIHYVKKSILFFLLLSFLPISALFFTNNKMPAFLTPTPLLSYRTGISSFCIAPFIISSKSAYQDCLEKFYQKRIGVYETEGELYLQMLYNALRERGSESLYFPSEWRAKDFLFPLKLLGSIEGGGVTWNFRIKLLDSLLFGWESAFCSMNGILTIQPQQEKNIPLCESILNQLFQSYTSLSRAAGVEGLYDHQIGFSDQNIYVRYEYATDFVARMRRIKGSIQGGLIIATAPKASFNNPASFPLGQLGNYGGYGTLQLDLLLKEDIAISGFITEILQSSRTQYVRIPVEGVPSSYSPQVASCTIHPGNTFLGSFSLSLEGIRGGFGAKGSYEAAIHSNDTIVASEVIPYGGNSGWAQEHITISLFYDWMREYEEHDLEPFFAFTFQIPTQIFTGYNAVKSYVLSVTVELLY